MDELDYLVNPSRRSGIRERALAKTLGRVREISRSAIEVREKRGLSPLERALNAQYESLLRSADVRISDSLRAIRQQNAAEQAQEEAFRRASPLAQARIREGLYRSGQDRMAAILGYLDRERRARAPLSREAEARAKAIAASRSSYDVKSAYRRGADRPGVSGTFGPEHLRGVDISQSDVDPCVEYLAKQKVRREVMFASRTAGRGYHVGHRRNPC